MANGTFYNDGTGWKPTHSRPPLRRPVVGRDPGYPDWSRFKWYVMGDSLTERTGTYTQQHYYDFVRAVTGIQTIVDGVSATGYRCGADRGVAFLDRVKNIPEDVDVVSIFGSGNDITADETSYGEIYRTLAWLVLNRPGVRVVVVPPSPWKKFEKRGTEWTTYCERLRLSAQACEARYVADMFDCPPFNGKFESHVEMFFTTDPTGIHPNEEGHRALAPFFYNALAQELALK